MKDVLYIFTRDPIDLIVFFLVVFVFVFWAITKNEKVKDSIGGAFIIMIGYVFYVMYRFAVLYSIMDENIKDEILRKTLGL